MVKNMVAAGKCELGWTDTDDFFAAVDDGHPVDCLPARLDDGKTLCIPNTVCIIKGTRNLAAAQRLVDFLLSEKTESKLAHSKSRQIPLGSLNGEPLPERVQELREWAVDSHCLREVAHARGPCLEWLKSEYLR